MQNYFERLVGKDASIFLIFLSIFIFLISLWHRNPHVDDAWIGEQAYWLSKIGYVKSELMRGINQQEIKNLLHHKFFTLNGALAIKLFGYSLWTLKSVSLFWMLIFLNFYIKFLKKNFQFLWILGLSMFVIHAFIQEYAFVYRPEIMVMTFGFFSYLSLERYLNSPKSRVWDLIFSGLFAGLAAVTHLNGLIFCMSGFTLLLLNKKIKSAIWFSISTIPTLLIYIYDITTKNDFLLWKQQFFQSPAIEAESAFSIGSFFYKILDEHQLFFHSPKEIIFTLLFILSLFIVIRSKSYNKIMISYLGLLIFSLAIISFHNTSRYTILYLPYMIFVIVQAVNYLKNIAILDKIAVSFTIILSVFYGVHIYYDITIASNKFYVEKHRALSLKAIGQTTSNLKIVAPMEFIFNEIEHYKSIQSDLGYMDLARAGKISSAASFLNYAEKNDIDYIIVNPVFDNFLNISKDLGLEKDLSYTLWKNIDGYLVLKHSVSH